jgi:hypothetical protein
MPRRIAATQRIDRFLEKVHEALMGRERVAKFWGWRSKPTPTTFASPLRWKSVVLLSQVVKRSWLKTERLACA